MSAFSRKRFALLLRVFVSAAALTLALRLSAIADIAVILKNSSLTLVAGGVVLQILTRIAAAERTSTVTRALGFQVTRMQTIETMFITNFYSLFLPDLLAGGLGTIHRYRGYGVAWQKSMGALILSRSIEVAVFLAFGILAFAIDPHVDLSTMTRAATIGGTIAISALGLVAMAQLPTRGRSMLDRHQQRHGNPSPLAMRFRDLGLQLVGLEAADIVGASLPALLQLMTGAAGVVLFAAAMNLDLAMMTAIWVIAAAYAATLLPFSIAGIGVRELVLVHVLGMVGADPAVALAISLLLLSCQLLCAVVGGLLQVRSSRA